MKSNVAAVVVVCLTGLVLFVDRQGVEAIPAQCRQSLIGEEVPVRIRRVCALLAAVYELGSAMENYVEDKSLIIHEGNQLQDNIAKRQDVDHVFLRFGKRR